MCLRNISEIFNQARKILKQYLNLSNLSASWAELECWYFSVKICEHQFYVNIWSSPSSKFKTTFFPFYSISGELMLQVESLIVLIKFELPFQNVLRFEFGPFFCIWYECCGAQACGQYYQCRRLTQELPIEDFAGWPTMSTLRIVVISSFSNNLLVGPRRFELSGPSLGHFLVWEIAPEEVRTFSTNHTQRFN